MSPVGYCYAVLGVLPLLIPELRLSRFRVLLKQRLCQLSVNFCRFPYCQFSNQFQTFNSIAARALYSQTSPSRSHLQNTLYPMINMCTKLSPPHLARRSIVHLHFSRFQGLRARKLGYLGEHSYEHTLLCLTDRTIELGSPQLPPHS